MARLPCTLETFSEAVWQRAFGAYVKANRSHWVGPPFDVVRGILERAGAYEFGVPALGMWTSRFRLAVLPDGALEATFVKNPDLAPHMRAHLERMEEVFEEELNRFTTK